MSKAHYLAKKAEREGVVENPRKCETCGNTKKSLVKHHRDYSKPIDITWLCRSCHKAEHHANPEMRMPGPVRAIIAVFGTESEKAALQKIKNEASGDRNLSWSDFVLEHFGIRKAEK